MNLTSSIDTGRTEMSNGETSGVARHRILFKRRDRLELTACARAIFDNADAKQIRLALFGLRLCTICLNPDQECVLLALEAATPDWLLVSW